MVLNILLVAILFLAGLINLFFFLPTSKLFVWIRSFLSPSNSSSSSNCTSSSMSQQTNNKNKNRNKSELELRRIFATFDKNSDGFITKQELRESLKNIRIFMTDTDLEDMVVKVDSNNDGLIDFDEFCFLCQSLIGTTTQEKQRSNGKEEKEEEEEEEEEQSEEGEEELKEAFEVFDRDKDGLISVEELGLVLCSLGLKEGKKMDDCKEMIKKVDMDGDGMVNFNEFKKMMMKDGGTFLFKS